jgi:maltooligosyltrehalose trehalohydrolase
MNKRRILTSAFPSPSPRPSACTESRFPTGDPGEWRPSLGAWPDGPGTRFRVWAPEHESIDVIFGCPAQPGRIVPLKKEPDGTFCGYDVDAHEGDLYRYRIDGHNTYPDPASRFQPEGVHGASQIIDPARFQWSDSGWKGIPAKDLIIYELHVGTFTPEGTFESVTRRLPYLAQLGVTAIELMPLGDFPGLHNWGYDGVALFAPARCYGTPDDLRQLVNTAHKTGIAVLIDVVYNHFGPDGNYTGAFSPYYVTPRHRSPWGPGINFDSPHHEFVREFYLQNALHWLHEYHADGLRLDATHAIVDDSERHILRDLQETVQMSVQDRPVHLIAEDNRNENTLVAPVSEGGFGLTAVWSDDFHHQIRAILAGDNDGYFIDYSDRVSDLVRTIRDGWLYSGQFSEFFQAPRGTSPAARALQQFIFFLQNHDQIGNRAFGERLNHQISLEDYLAASALLLAVPETPMLFMGQEWAASSPFQYFTDHDEELGKAVTEGRRNEFKTFATFMESSSIPDPQDPETFRRSVLNWDEKLHEPHVSVGLFYRALLKLRRDTFKRPVVRAEFSADAVGPGAVVLRRPSQEGRTILIMVQFHEAGTVDLTREAFAESLRDRDWDVLLTSEDKTFANDPQTPVIHVSGAAPIVEFLRPGAVILQAKCRYPI